MITAFQRSAFQNNAFQIDPTAGQTVLMPGPSGSAFTRKRFDEIRAAQRAQEEAQRSAAELKQSKRKRLLEAAAMVAAEAIVAVRADEDRESLARMTRALEAASGAVRTATAIREARAAIEAANAILEMEDEEEVEMLLLH